MKKIKSIILCFMLLSFLLLLISCSKKDNDNTSNTTDNTSTTTDNTSNTTDNTSNTTDNSTSSSDGTQTFTLDELKEYDGQDCNSAYVAVNGVVYDVTNVKEWANGKHKNGLVAGADLTSAIGDSPHGEKVLKDLPVMGTLE
ncbi:MAG: hypothetical protein K0R46_592 [Herbinix sp.]|nr:hypothetical protein [Herbinix sp.]